MSDLESKLRAIFDIPGSDMSPERRIQHLGAFWPHWTLHKRKCDRTGRDIISVFRPECPYPVWHKDEWFRSAQPPRAQFDFSQSFFPQAEKLFKQCPIAHNTGSNNENCEYTDDAWSSRDCYLCHSMFESQNARYNLKGYWSIDSIYIVASYKCERCIDCTNCHTCFECVHCLNMKNSRNVLFSFDCKGCSDCLFCYNLRNKKYCIGNQQYTPEQYREQKKQFDYSTVTGFQKCQQFFQKILRERAYFRTLEIDNAENAQGNYLEEAKNVESTYYMSRIEDVANCMRGTMAKTCLDCVSSYDAERMYMCSAVQLHCYDVMYSFQLMEARFVLYSAYSAQIENCFGCCGLVNGKHCILNTPYSTQEYDTLRTKIIAHMKSTGEWGRFFPGSFAPNPYNESWSSFYFPLTPSEQQKEGYFYLSQPEKRNNSYHSIDSLPHTPHDASELTTKDTYWDDISEKPFQILAQDINLCRALGVALPHSYYMRRIQENFKWMPYNGALRTTVCAKSGAKIQTLWPSEYDGRIVSEEEYLKIVG